MKAAIINEGPNGFMAVLDGKSHICNFSDFKPSEKNPYKLGDVVTSRTDHKKTKMVATEVWGDNVTANHDNGCTTKHFYQFDEA